MRNFQFFINKDYIAGETVTITGNLVHRIKNVLRYKKGDTLRLVLPGSKVSQGKKFTADITEISDKVVRAEIVSSETTTDTPLIVTLYISMIKHKSFETALQKATELGVSRIVPLRSERSVIKINAPDMPKKMSRWESILIEASSQCKRPDIPQLLDAVDVGGIAKLNDNADIKIVCDENADTCLRDHLKGYGTPSGISAAVGPEGGFSASETAILSRAGFFPVLLSDNILRSETVPICIMSIIQYEFGGYRKG